MRLAVGHGKHVRYTSMLSLGKKQRKGIRLPIISELVRIPTPLLEASTVDGAYTLIYSGDADLVRSQPDNVSMLHMRCMNGAIFLLAISYV